jgi:hypothetical protein
MSWLGLLAIGMLAWVVFGFVFALFLGRVLSAGEVPAAVSDSRGRVAGQGASSFARSGAN